MLTDSVSVGYSSAIFISQSTKIHRMVKWGKSPEVAETLTPWRTDDHLALMERKGVEMQSKGVISLID